MTWGIIFLGILLGGVMAHLSWVTKRLLAAEEKITYLHRIADIHLAILSQIKAVPVEQAPVETEVH